MSRPPTPQPTTRRERRAQARTDRPGPQRKKIVRRQPTARPRWQSPVILTTIGAIVIGAIVILVAGGSLFGGSNQLQVPETSYTGLPVNGEKVGSPTAPVVMQVYSDFQCPACKYFYTTEMTSLMNDLVKPGLLRIESTDIDIIDGNSGTESLNLAVGAKCAAEQNLYWPFHDYVYWNQGRENHGDHNAAFIDRMATVAGLDMTAFHACQARGDLKQPILDATRAAAAAGVGQTPTLVVNGQMIPGVPQYSQLKSLILQLAAQSPAPSTSPASSAPASAVPSALPS